MVRQQEGRLLYCVDLFMQANNTCIVVNLHVRTIHKQGGWSDGRMVDCNVWMHSHMKSYCRLAQFYLSYKSRVDDFEQSDNMRVDCVPSTCRCVQYIHVTSYLPVRANPPIRSSNYQGDKNIYATTSVLYPTSSVFITQCVL